MITLLKIPHDVGLIKDRNKTMQAKFPNNNASFLGDNVNAKVCFVPFSYSIGYSKR